MTGSAKIWVSCVKNLESDVALQNGRCRYVSAVLSASNFANVGDLLNVGALNLNRKGSLGWGTSSRWLQC